jgi:hypothetical protein
MNFTKLLLFVAVIGLGYHFWDKYQMKKEWAAARATASPNGFIPLPPPENVNPKTVLVIAAENCPKEGARRSDALAQQLASRNIPYARAHDVSFTLIDGDAKFSTRLDMIMNGEVPIVLINGKGKANPTLEEVVAEYEASR